MSQKKKRITIYVAAAFVGLSASLILPMLSPSKFARSPQVDNPQSESLNEIDIAVQQYMSATGRPTTVSDLDGIEIGGRQAVHKFRVANLYGIASGIRYTLTTQYLNLDRMVSIEQIIIAFSMAYDHPNMVRILYANGAIALKSQADFQSEVVKLDAALAKTKGP